MLSGLAWLALEVVYLEPALAFYTRHLDLDVIDRTAGEAALGVGEAELRLRTPGPVPRGGLHTHYALTVPADGYDDWRARLAADLDVEEHDFGAFRSLYAFDPDGHCVELAGAAPGGAGGPGVTDVFEVVLEVEDLDRAEALYRALGGTVTGRGDDRRRVRLDLGPVDLELWEPQLGLADARGGVHLDLGFRAADPAAVADAVRGRVRAVTPVDGGVRLLDPDGHYLTVLSA